MADCPALTALDAGVAATEKSVAEPLKRMSCPQHGALWVNVMVAVLSPTSEGLKVGVAVQLAPAARVAGLIGQFVTWLKSLESGPVTWTL